MDAREKSPWTRWWRWIPANPWTTTKATTCTVRRSPRRRRGWAAPLPWAVTTLEKRSPRRPRRETTAVARPRTRERLARKRRRRRPRQHRRRRPRQHRRRRPRQHRRRRPRQHRRRRSCHLRYPRDRRDASEWLRGNRRAPRRVPRRRPSTRSSRNISAGRGRRPRRVNRIGWSGAGGEDETRSWRMTSPSSGRPRAHPSLARRRDAIVQSEASDFWKVVFLF